MALVFKTPKSTLNTTTKVIQNLGGDCPPCPEPVLESTELEYTQNGEYAVTPEQGVDGFSQVEITVNVPSDVNNQNKTVSPSTSSQTVSADSGYSGLGTVTVNPVTSAIDQNIAAGNIKKDVSILGVTGNYDPQPNLSNLNITPSTNAQEYNPAISGVDGYSLVSVSAVTAAIDNNIAAGNIKSGVSILGVTGNYDPQPELQAKTVNPSTSQQTVSPDQGKDGLSTVTVNAVTNAIDANIQAGNIKSGVSILGVQGSYDPQPSLESGSVAPDVVGTTTYEPAVGYDGFSSVNVEISPDSITGTIGSPFDNGGYQAMEEADYSDAYYWLSVDSGSIDQTTGDYIAEESNGSTFAIKPYLDDGEGNLIFPEDFDLVGKEVEVYFNKENVQFNKEGGLITSIEIEECDLVAVDSNYNLEALPFGTLEITANGTYDPTGYAEIDVSVSGGGTQCPDWSSIGWTCSEVTASGITADVAHTAQKLANYTDFTDAYWQNDADLVYAPNIIIRQARTFYNDGRLVYVPNLKFKSGQFPNSGLSVPNVELTSMFENCYSLQSVNLDLTDIGDGSQSNGYVVGASSMFKSCSHLSNVTLTNTSGLLSTSCMFASCSALTSIPLFDTSSVINMESMFRECTSLQTIPQFNTSNVTTFETMFYRCSSLTMVPLLDASKVANINGMFGTSNSYMTKNLTTLGGFTNLGKAFTGSSAGYHMLNFQYNTVLTKQSIMNVINNLSAPDDATCTDATLKLSATCYALLDASDIAVATAKNWSVVSA